MKETSPQPRITMLDIIISKRCIKKNHFMKKYINYLKYESIVIQNIWKKYLIKQIYLQKKNKKKNK